MSIPLDHLKELEVRLAKKLAESRPHLATLPFTRQMAENCLAAIQELIVRKN